MNSTDILTLVREVSYVLVAILSFWLGQKGISGVVSDIQNDISWVKNEISNLKGLVSTTPAPTVPVTVNAPVA